jgi:hypothetical protein
MDGFEIRGGNQMERESGRRSTSAGRSGTVSKLAVVLSTLAVVLSLVFVAHAEPAEGYVLDAYCSFSGTNPRLDYWRNSLTSSWNTAFNNGQAAWDAKTPGYGAWFATAQNSTAAEIQVYDAGYSSTWTALTTRYGSCSSWGGVVWTSIRFNLNQDDGMDATDKKKTAVHELGHVLGLGHTYYSCSKPSAMRQGMYVIDVCGLTSFPFSDDTSGAYALYH